MGVTRTGGRPGLPGNNNYKVFEAGAKKLGYKERRHRDGWRSTRSTTTTGSPASRPASASRAASGAPSGRRPTPTSRAARRPATRGARPAPWRCRSSTTTTGRVTGRRLRRQGRQAAAAEGEGRLRRGQLHREPAAAAQLGVVDVPGRAGQLLGAGRAQLHAAHHRLGLRDLRGAGQDVARHDDGRRSSATRRGTIPSRGFVGGYELETLSLGLPFMAAFLDPGAWGREFTSALDGYDNMAGMWIVGEDMPQETNRVTLNHGRQGRVRPAGAERALRRPSERRRHAQPRLCPGRGDLPGGRARRGRSRRRPIPRRTTSAPTG